MRYAIIDDEGATVDSSDAWSDVVARLHDLDQEEPGVLSQLWVLHYYDSGLRHGEPESAELVANLDTARRVFISFTGSYVADAWLSGYGTLVADVASIVAMSGPSAYPFAERLHPGEAARPATQASAGTAAPVEAAA